MGRCRASRELAARQLRALLLTTTALSFAALPAAAQDATWSATPGSGDFNTASNWSPGVPSAADTANITVATGNAPTLGGAGAAASVNVNNNTLTISGAGNLVITNLAVSVGGTVSNSGAITAAGNVINSGTITSLGSFNVSGSMGNAGTLNTAGGTLASLHNNGGAFTANTGTISGNVTLSGGVVDNNAGGIMGGSLMISGGTFNANAGSMVAGLTTVNAGATLGLNGGTFTGGLALSGNANAAGTFSGAVNNLAAFNVVGALVGDNTFTNTGAGVLNVTGGNYTGITTLTNNSLINIGAGLTLSAARINNNAGSITLGAGSTLQGTGNTLNNNAVINVGAGGTITDAGAINNLAAGQINFVNGGTLTSGIGMISNAGAVTVAAGNLTVNGGLTNTGLINLQNGVTNNIVTIAGAYTGGGAIAVDYDLATRTADRVTVSGGTSGNTIINLNGANRVGGTAVAGTNIVIVQGAGAATYTVNGSNLASGGSVVIDNTGVYQQLAQNIGGSLQIVSAFNVNGVSGFTSAVSNVLSSQSSVAEPASAYVTGPVNPDPNTFHIGAWSRLKGGEFTLRSATRFSTATVRNELKTQFQDYQLGIDVGLCNINNTKWNVIVGIHGGQLTGSSGNGDSSVSLDQPYGGAYLIVKNDAFTFDAMIRHEKIDMKVSSASSGVQKAPLSGNGWSGLINAQYRFPISERFTLTPSAGLLFSKMDMGALNAVGFSTTWRPVDSMIGRVGLEISTTHQLSSQFLLVPSAKISVGHEFAGHIQSNTAGFTSSTTRIGTYGQASLGLSVTSLTPGFSGFVRSDLRFGSKVDGYALNGGVRWQF